MIRVTVELIRPHGLRPQELARIEISNAGGTAGEADYSVKSVTRLLDGSLSIQQRGVWAFRRRDWNVLGLVYAALNGLGTGAMRNEGHHEIPERV